MESASEQPADELCTACFSGVYPLELPSEERLGKSVLELDFADGSTPLPDPGPALDVEHVATGVATGGADAVRRP